MKTKMIFAIAALLMLGSVCLNAQEKSNGSTSTDYSKQPFTVVPLEKDLIVSIMGYKEVDFYGYHYESAMMHYSYDLGQTWKSVVADGNSFKVNVGQKISFKITTASDDITSYFGVSNQNKGDTEVGKYNVEGNLGTMHHQWHGKGYFSGQTSLVSAENLIIPDNYTCESRC